MNKEDKRTWLIIICIFLLLFSFVLYFIILSRKYLVDENDNWSQQHANTIVGIIYGTLGFIHILLGLFYFFILYKNKNNTSAMLIIKITCRLCVLMIILMSIVSVLQIILCVFSMKKLLSTFKFKWMNLLLNYCNSLCIGIDVSNLILLTVFLFYHHCVFRLLAEQQKPNSNNYETIGNNDTYETTPFETQMTRIMKSDDERQSTSKEVIEDESRLHTSTNTGETATNHMDDDEFIIKSSETAQ